MADAEVTRRALSWLLNAPDDGHRFNKACVCGMDLIVDPQGDLREARAHAETCTVLRQEASGECAHDWVPMVGGEVCYGCNCIRRYDNVTYTAPEPIATLRPADAVTEAMRDLLASAIGQAVVSCAHFASHNIPTEAWNVDYAGIIARALAALGLTPEGA